MDLTNIYRTCHPEASKHILFLSTLNVLQAGPPIRTQIPMWKKEFSPTTVSNTKINNKRNSWNFTNAWRLNNMFLNEQWIIEEIKTQILKKSLKLMKMGTQQTKIWGYSRSTTKWKVYWNKCLHQKIENY